MAIYYARLTFNANCVDPVQGLPSSIEQTSNENAGHDYIVFDIPQQEPTRSGYTFKEWQLTDDYGNTTSYKYSASPSFSENGTSENPYSTLSVWGYSDAYKEWTLYAIWEESTEEPDDKLLTYGYILTFDANGGYGEPSNITVTEDSYEDFNRSITTYIPFDEPTRDYYAFNGWNTSKDGSGYTVNAGAAYLAYATTAPFPEYKLYAIWTPIYYATLTFNANGKSYAYGIPDSMDGQSENNIYIKFNIPELRPSCSGFKFKEWNTKSDGSGDVYEYGKEYSFWGTNSLPGQEHILYAIWEDGVPIYYATIKFDVNNNKEKPNELADMSNSSTNENQMVTFNIPECRPEPEDGYIFDGWEFGSDIDYIAQPAEEIALYGTEVPPGFDGHMVYILYAVWKESPTDGFAWIYVNGLGWVKAIPHVYSNGTWHQAIPYVYKNGRWHTTI